MFRIEMLPARQGDAILIEYGAGPSAPHRLLIDGGTPGTKRDLRARLGELGAPPRRFELLVVTHIDGDHIGGILELLEEDPNAMTFADVWFNAWRHLPATGAAAMGPVQGERLSTWLDDHRVPWNQAFRNGPVAIADDGALPRIELAEDLRVTLLSPGNGELAALKEVWEEEVRKAGLEPGEPYRASDGVPATVAAMGPSPTRAEVEEWAARRFQSDDSEANGSSICVLLEYENHSILLTGDGHSHPLIRGLARLLEEREEKRLQVDVLKLPHHGSRRNVSTSLLESVGANDYLFSTNGAQYGHPDLEAVARVALGAEGRRLCFNYASRVGLWEEPSLVEDLGYSIHAGNGRLSIQL